MIEISRAEDDAISRQAVLDTLDKMDKALDTDRTVESYKELLTECHKVLPSVTPKEKTGKWINDWEMGMSECSCCGETYLWEDYKGTENFHFCPNCGVRMIEPQESEDKSFGGYTWKVVVAGNCVSCGKHIDGDNIFLCKDCQGKQSSGKRFGGKRE